MVRRFRKNRNIIILESISHKSYGFFITNEYDLCQNDRTELNKFSSDICHLLRSCGFQLEIIVLDEVCLVIKLLSKAIPIYMVTDEVQELQQLVFTENQG